jgi:D-alanyl-D-alanine carboxypeptidase
MVDASARGWGAGWPAVRSDEMVDLVVGGVSFPGGVHRDVAGLMEALLAASVEQGWLTLKDGWCWGYANRPIKTPTGGFTDTPSNHSWGLAIDVNAPENPFGGTTHAIPEEMGDFWETWGFRWGGRTNCEPSIGRKACGCSSAEKRNRSRRAP